MVSDGLDSSVLRVIGHTRRAISFARFAYKHGKRYEDVEEIKLRFQIFKDNMDLIRSTNKKGLPYSLSVNRTSSLVWNVPRYNPKSMSRYNLRQSPYDIRMQGFINGVLWILLAFSTTGALEAAYHQAFGKGISLSEQQLVDCAGAFNNFGCNGGLPSQAFEYIKYNGGLDTEEAYPYTAKDGQCTFSSENVGVQVIDAVNITLGSEDELKHAVAMVRPVSVAFEVVPSFNFYKSGVYTSDKCGNTSSDVNHLFLQLDMELKMESRIGSLRTHGEQNGVTRATSRWKWAKTCVVWQHVHHTPLLLDLRERS
ncbi:hypothetical protein ES319_1Z155200v1 [Gossypium barbadense]|uniref:Peptidase C1A papain C-terminal domain-containing protein n=1 Tax=Gossypium barbadense TaxID=3634 RepID=A0A5J5NC21_GOSBA|nr:hypothetical protein ES319_1Z155200v1 [Gossypium barbadense]